MRFYLNASEEIVNTVSDGVFLTNYSDGYTKENYFIKFDDEIIFQSKGWEMPTNQVFKSKRGNTIMFSESGYIKNGPEAILDITDSKLEANYDELLQFLDEDWQDAYDCGFESLSRFDKRELISELTNVRKKIIKPFNDGAFIFSESAIFEKREVKFIYESLASGKLDDVNDVAIDWICDDGLLLNGEQPTESQKKEFNQKINWASNNNNGGMTGRYRG